MTGPSHPAFSDLPRWLLDSLGEGISIADAEGRIVYSNKAADRILGKPATGGPPKDWADYYGIFMADGRTRFPTDHYPLVRALRGESTNEVEMVVRNRAQPWDVRIAATGRPLLDSTGEVVGATVVFRDITALSRAQVELAETNEELRRMQQLQEELSTFVVHDLNGPLTGILTLTELLLLEDGLGEETRRSIGDLRELAHSLHAIAVDLLDLRVAEDGMLRPAREVLAMDDVLAEVGAAMGPRAELAEKRLSISGTGAGLEVFADPDLLRRTLQNLVDNSIKYAPPGGTILLRACPGEAGMVRIEVADEGPGIPPDYRERIFDKYASVERDEALGNRRSRGLGLRFCRVATEAQGGRVWVEDASPTGARFCVELRAGR